MPSKICLCFRRAHDVTVATKIHERLAAKVGLANIVIVDDLLAHLRPADKPLQLHPDCAVLVAVVGPEWPKLFKDKASKGEPDFMREAIAEALGRGIDVVLVRVDANAPPDAATGVDELPEDIRALAHCAIHDIARAPGVKELNALTGAVVSAYRGARARSRVWKPTRFVWASLAATALTLIVLAAGISYYHSGRSALAMQPLAETADEGGGTDLDRAARVRACDLLAASPLDRTRPADIPGVAFDKLDAAKAIPACRRALASAPDDPRVQYQLGRAYDAAAKDELAQAAALYRKAAERSHVLASFNLAKLYLDGRGVPKDHGETARWTRIAADGGFAPAMGLLAQLYLKGDGLSQDTSKAIEWFEKAVAAGDSQALVNIGAIYSEGEGIPEDDALAYHWFSLAADAGQAMGMTNLGLLYEQGKGVPRNIETAIEWYQKAAALEEPDAMNNLAMLYENGDGVSQDYAKAAEWYRKAAEKGSAQAMTNLGSLYANGRGVPQDYAKAAEWYEKGSERGSFLSMNNLGLLYANGQGFAKDFLKAKQWLERAANGGLLWGMVNLGWLYTNSSPPDYAKARYWFETAAGDEFPLAITNLGVLYANGHGVRKNETKAVELYQKAADLGEPLAMYNLGLAYLDGMALTKDPVKARFWLEKAAENGNADAVTELARLPSP